jgi:hypothetical protein
MAGGFIVKKTKIKISYLIEDENVIHEKKKEHILKSGVQSFYK